MIHRSCRIWTINGLDPIGISQSVKEGEGYWRLSDDSCDNDQLEQTRTVDQVRRSMAQVNSQYGIGTI